MMDDIRSTLGRMRRPPFLVRAARIGAAHYLRERVLGRVLGPGPLPVPASALRLLFEIESEAERARRARAAAYSAARHVELLIAVMGEAALLADAPAAPPAAQPKASGISDLRRAT